MTEPCAVAYHGVDRATIHAGDSAAVFGGGPIGVMAAQWLRIRGCSPVLVSEPDRRKRELVARMGFTTIDPTPCDPVDAVVERTGGGADIAVEACGLPETFRQAVNAAGLFGRVVFIGNISGAFELDQRDMSAVLRRELTIHGTWNSRIAPRGKDEWTRVLASMRGDVDLTPLVSHRVSLEEAPQMVEAMHARSTWFNKVLIYPGLEAT